ncbi:MAG: tetratricopeptide repeat protein [Flavobacteriales bacterium]|nr:tetratricopeptide repeat protein [Flavobacteriales bacterium]
MKNIATIVFLILSVSLNKHSQGQDVNLDSLWTVWNDHTQPDTNRLKAINDIAWKGYLFTQPDSAFYFAQIQYDFAKSKGFKEQMAAALNTQGASFYIQSDYPSAIDYYIRALSIIEKAGVKKGIAGALGNIGILYKEQGNYHKAIEYSIRSLTIEEEIGHKKGIANSLNDIGNIYKVQGNYRKAIDYHTRSLTMMEEIGDKLGIAASLSNIGHIYEAQVDYHKAIDHYTRSLTIEEEIGNKRGMANSLNNIGSIYENRGDSAYRVGNVALSTEKYAIALEYYNRSLTLGEELGDKMGIAISLNNIGIVYMDQGNYPKAIDYHTRSLTISEDIGDKIGVASSLNSIGIIYEKQGDDAHSQGNTILSKNKYASAIEFSTQALTTAQEVGTILDIRDAANALYRAYKAIGRQKSALEMHELYITTRDSIESEANQKELMRQKFKYDYEKKEAVTNAEHQAKMDKQEAIAAEEQEKQYIIIGSVSSGLGSVVLFSIFLFNRFQVTRKQKTVIEAQKEEVDRAYNSLEEKNKEITDSINYAQRIQAAILPPDRMVKKYLTDSFVLYKPKDIVAGDFYWMEPVGDQIIFAVADCTGHGVPGAMLSMLCNNALNRSVREYGLTDPGKILDKTREIVIAEFEKSDEHVKDGMDISLCTLNGNKLQFAGAYNLLWIVRNKEVIELKGDRQPIGNSDDPKPFTTHSFDLKKGDLFYIFSDGYLDQFGGVKGKKLKVKAFREILLRMVDKPMPEQKVLMDEAFEKWRGDLEQIDDVCIIGVKG